ncbi:MAG: RES family NAD+ phosphorylase [Gemmatimonadales bacterium]
MIPAWRIVKQRLARAAFDGEGARLYGTRWTSVGRRVVCTSSTVALATLEIVAHLDSTASLSAYSLFEAQIPEVLVETVDAPILPPDWMAFPDPLRLATIGDAWLDSDRSAVLNVPSAIVGIEFNYLLNPLHRDFPLIQIGPEQPYRLDLRLI